jgi:hypothetical protein
MYIAFKAFHYIVHEKTRMYICTYVCMYLRTFFLTYFNRRYSHIGLNLDFIKLDGPVYTGLVVHVRSNGYRVTR